MISGIGSGSYMDYSQMVNMGGQKKNPFTEADSDGDGSLTKTEMSAFSDKVSEMTGQTVDVEEMFSNMDTDEDDLISQAEFEAGRPGRPGSPPAGMTGPPPGMRGGMEGNGIESLLNTLNSEDDEDSTDLTDALDANGDGVVDAEGATSEIINLLQEYVKQSNIGSNQSSASGGQINVLC